MLHFFPSAWPDETLYSRLARYHRLSGHTDDRTTLGELIGLHTHVITSHLPSLLTALVARLPGSAKSSVEELIKSSTIFPYFQAFLPSQRSMRAIEAMSSLSTSGLKMMLGLVASRLGGHNVFRFCRSCALRDRDLFGQAYWHRTHQLPGVWVCPTHSEPMYELDGSVVQLKRHKLFLPDDEYVGPNARQLRLSPNEAEAVLRVSVLSMDVLMGNRAWDVHNLRDMHRENAMRSNLIRTNGRIRIAELAKMLHRYSSNLPAYGEYGVLRNNYMDWVPKLLRKPRGNALHPMKHIILIDCLRSNSQIEGANAPNRQARKEMKSQRQNPRIDEPLLSIMLGEKNLTLTQTATELGLSVTTVRVEAVRLGLPLRGLRPKVLTDEVKLRICGSLQDGLNPQEVANKHGVSLVSVYRILRMDKQLAAEYADLRFRILRDSYRKRFGEAWSQADYSWLRRHDIEWLAQQKALTRKREVTRTSCVDWAARDEVLANQIVEISKAMRELDGKPKWVSRTALERGITKAETIERNAEKLPMTHAALSTYSETLEEYQMRRLQWAALELQKQSSDQPRRWQLLRLAGIRRLAGQNEDLLRVLTSLPGAEDYHH